MTGGPPANPGGHPLPVQPAAIGGGAIKYHAVADTMLKRSRPSPVARIERTPPTSEHPVQTAASCAGWVRGRGESLPATWVIHEARVAITEACARKKTKLTRRALCTNYRDIC